MKFSEKNIFLFLLFFTLAAWIAIIDRAPMYWNANADLTNILFGIVKHTPVSKFLGPIAYRILIPYTWFYTHEIFPFLSYSKIDFVLKIVILTCTQFSFFYYLLKFFDFKIALFGVLWLDVFVSYSLSFFLGINVLETSDLFNLMILCFCLQQLYDKNWRALSVLLFVGMLNRETPGILLIPAALMLYKEPKRVIYFSLLLCAVFIPYFGIKLILPVENSQWFMTDYISWNIPFIEDKMTPYAIKSLVRFALLLGAVSIMAFYKFKQKDTFLKTMAALVPPFLVIHFIVGIIIEIRLWIPLFVILIPLALQSINTIFENENSTQLK